MLCEVDLLLRRRTEPADKNEEAQADSLVQACLSVSCGTVCMIPNQKYDENKPANRPVSYETQQGVFALLCGLPASRISTRGGDKGEEESISTPSGLL